LATPLQPYDFAGEVALDCQLLGGLSMDFNVMVRRSRARATVGVLRWAPGPLQGLPAMRQGLLLAVAGNWQLAEACACGAPHRASTLAPGQGLWWRAREANWQLQTSSREAALLWVQIEELHDFCEEV
jgi:environmental stress-induced protein Ves